MDTNATKEIRLWHFVIEIVMSLLPFVTAPGNRNETILLAPAISILKSIVKQVGLDLKGSTMSLDGVYNSRTSSKAIFNLGMMPNVPENKRNRKKSKRGKKQTLSKRVFKERFRTIERFFAWGG